MTDVRYAITVRGAVQGVGFRPWLHRRAAALGLGGWAANTDEGLAIEVEGSEAAVTRLLTDVRMAPPPHARIAAVEARATARRGERVFAIRPSVAHGGGSAEVPVDLATCAACLAELSDPRNRRYRYPFINCTQCGPRYTILDRLPYDRASTSMRDFTMCRACRAEYEDPCDRRFHAEPIGCPDCGPRVAFADGGSSAGDDVLARAAMALAAGAIVAVKGIGGFHLLVDARNEAAVRRLRERKGRGDKPFAVMVPDLAAARSACHVSALEAEWLAGPVAPIVLLRRAADGLARSVAPDNALLGVLLPYSPLHHLLLSAFGAPVVATSGNVGGEPIAFEDDDARGRLPRLADVCLVHDRPIRRPVDDSIVRIVAGRALVLRCARGLAPATIECGERLRAGVAARGGHLKTTCAVTRGSTVVLSQHLGDLESPAARAGHVRALADLARLHGVAPSAQAGDLHPDYAGGPRPAFAVQHHLAHALACVADAQVRLPVLAVVFDGGGDGGDGTVWGGEFLLVEAGTWRRVASLRRFALPGGEAAVREPRRSALGVLHSMYGGRAFDLSSLAPVAAFAPDERPVLRAVLERGINAPLCSSVGRLFDAFASLAGLRQRTSYEGEAAAALESVAGDAPSDRPYLFELRERAPAREPSSIVAPVWDLDWQPAVEAAIADLTAGADAGSIARGFHDGLAEAIVRVARSVGIPRVALSGGCFQNARLTETTVTALRSARFEPVWHRRVPPNDGGLALGQAVWAARLAEAAPRCA